MSLIFVQFCFMGENLLLLAIQVLQESNYPSPERVYTRRHLKHSTCRGLFAKERMRLS